MGLRFSFIGSGSRGNCTLVESDKWKFLIDIGFGLRRTNEALRKLNTSIENIAAVILTHTHDDHAKKSMIQRIHQSNIALHCHQQHEIRIGEWAGYQYLQAKRLTKHYTTEPFEMLPGLTVSPIPVAHDAPGTHGFIFDFNLNDSNFRFIYAADCGHGSLTQLNQKCKNADLIALEFNHDEELEHSSSRPRFLVNRVLGPDGHLSNKQAAQLLGFIRSENLKNVVQLHLSNDCNTPELAMNSARQVIGDVAIHQTSQNEIGPIIEIN